MTKIENNKQYDLESRTLRFAKNARDFIKKLPRTLTNIEYSKQLARSSSSIGANYIEANEALGKKDFIMRLKICRKEAKETKYWLELVDVGGDDVSQKNGLSLLQEANELMMIFGAIIRKSV